MGILVRVRNGLLIIGLVLLPACGGPSGPLVEAYPDAARQIAVDGVENVELFCGLGEIGGILGPTAPEPLQAAEALAQQRGWRYHSLAETGGTKDRRLVVFSDAEGNPVAEVVVAKNQGELLPPTTAPQGADPANDDDKNTGWLTVGVQACEAA